MADFGGPDLEAFRAEAKEWLEANFPKSLGKDVAAQTAAIMSPEAPTGDHALWKERMGAKGWGVPTWPKAYGGGGLSAAEARLLQGFLQDAQQHLRQHQFDKAKAFVESAQRIAPNAPEVLRLKRQIQEQETQYLRQNTTIQ